MSSSLIGRPIHSALCHIEAKSFVNYSTTLSLFQLNLFTSTPYFISTYHTKVKGILNFTHFNREHQEKKIRCYIEWSWKFCHVSCLFKRALFLGFHNKLAAVPDITYELHQNSTGQLWTNLVHITNKITVLKELCFVCSLTCSVQSFRIRNILGFTDSGQDEESFQLLKDRHKADHVKINK